MLDDEQNFYEFVYRLFYKFSQTTPEQVGLIFSKKLVYPLLKLNSDVCMEMPLPKLVDEKYVFEGLIFEDTEEGRKSMWSLFLATLYHLAGHAAVSIYHDYENWRKNKTDDICWQVIDFIEDIKVQRFISHTDMEIWANIANIESQFVTKIKESGTKGSKRKPYFSEENEKSRNLLRQQILASKGDDSNNMTIADYLYDNRELFLVQQLPYVEQHSPKWLLKFEEFGPKLYPSGVFEEQALKLDELWEVDAQAKRRIIRNYRKHLKNLQFDAIIVPIGNLQSYEKIKLKTLPMLRRVRQQIRMISNLTDDPKIDQIGYVDMQLAIQAIASEGQSNEIFERDELRRGEEAWIILIDKSASMRLRFDRLKEFAVCVSESANELTGKQDAWALYSFDNNFQILKDFKERYNREVQARIGGIENCGLSLLPDAIALSTKILSDDPRERKYLFIITDGHPSGYDRIHEVFSKIVRKTDVSGITLVAIGVTKTGSKKFRNSVRGTDLKQLVIKFITAYRTASSDM